MSTYSQTRVWDLFVRVSHWSLVLLYVLAYATGDEKGPWHRYIGYAILMIVILRVFWGIAGTKHALFADFICSPGKAIGYLKDMAVGKAKHYIGHNPAAAWMILFLLSGSLFVCFSGLMVCVSKENPSDSVSDSISLVGTAYADDDDRKGHRGKHERHGRNAKLEKEEDNERNGVWSALHEISALCMLFLIVVHMIGVAVSSKIHHENLVKSMITGKKTIPVA
jgi:cytochrome b